MKIDTLEIELILVGYDKIDKQLKEMIKITDDFQSKYNPDYIKISNFEKGGLFNRLKKAIRGTL